MSDDMRQIAEYSRLVAAEQRLNEANAALSSAERRIEELVRDNDWLQRYNKELNEKRMETEALVTTLRAEVEELKRRPDMLKQLLDDANAAHFDATMRADEAESRLASPTGQVEDAAREKVVAWMIQHSIATGHGDTLDDLLGELSAYVRKMQADRAPSPTSHRLLADAVVSRDERIASLTGQVEDMRERAAQLAEDRVRPGRVEFDTFKDGWNSAAGHIAGRIRSLPVLPTTGDGGGPDRAAALADIMGLSSGPPDAPTGRETSGEET